MSQELATNFLQAIKSDNLVHFSSLIKGNKTITLGRFPLLTLCYLYKAKKIIKNYQTELLNIQSYITFDEPISIYKDFRKIAGKCLRLYLQDDAIVYPIEILAIMQKDSKVKKLYNANKAQQKHYKKIKKIYTIYGQNVKNQNNKILIFKPTLSTSQTHKLKLSIFLALSCVVFASVCFSIFTFTTGVGTSFSPFVIQSEKQLSQALSSDGSYVLSSSINLNHFLPDKTFKGTIDGKNNTIYINDTSANYLIFENNGIIKNLNIVYKKTDRQISSSFSLFAYVNSGKIKNVNIVCEDLTLNCVKSQSDIYVNSIANTNTGTIENCSTLLKANILASGDGECYVGGLVGKNTGLVKNLILKQNSNIITQEADLSGIVSTNELGATVEKCKNYATLTQNSSLNGWFPNVSGIVQTNYGNISNCLNFGALNIISTNDAETAEGNIFLGGICAMNYSTIDKCLNKGPLKVSSKKIIVYCGGITAYSSYFINGQNSTNSKINNCGVDCLIDVATQDEKGFCFVGGISGYLYGESTNCYSLACFTNGSDNSKYFVGSFLGSTYFKYGYDETLTLRKYIFISVSNNFVLIQENIPYQIAALLNEAGRDEGIESINDKINNLSSIDQIKLQEVYWDEK